MRHCLGAMSASEQVFFFGGEPQGEELRWCETAEGLGEEFASPLFQYITNSEPPPRKYEGIDPSEVQVPQYILEKSEREDLEDGQAAEGGVEVLDQSQADGRPALLPLTSSQESCPTTPPSQSSGGARAPQTPARPIKRSRLRVKTAVDGSSSTLR